MSKLIEAINAEETVTENGMMTYSSSMDDVVDLFFKVGASRGKDIIPQFSKAFASDSDLAIRVALWARDVRGGSGERQLFRDIFAYVIGKDADLGRRILAKVPELGRWDDVYVTFGTDIERDGLRLIAQALKDGNGLCAKWMDRKGANANKVRAYLKMTPKEYRKLIVGLTNVVEQKMCADQWTDIEFGKLPSLASARYQGAFNRHAPLQYKEYKDKLKSGEATINAGAVYPYDVITSLKHGDEVVANAQWNALPDYLDGSTQNILPLVDVSGSMCCGIGGNYQNTVTCLDVAISLGMYISERSKGLFKDTFLTFTTAPKMQRLNGSLSDRYEQMCGADWHGSTNLDAAFELILNSAINHKVPQSEMPTMILIMSDMQFNYSCKYTANSMIDAKYTAAGYKRPSVVFWNLNSKQGVPARFDERGVALVSGFSPAIMESILKCAKFDPYNMMLEAIMKDRYSF